MDDLIVERKLCVGSGACTDGESFGSADLKIEDGTPELHFVETGSSGADWSITNNLQSAGSPHAFSINRITDDISPFVIEDGAPDNAFYVSSTGKIGVGTSLPTSDLQITSYPAADINFRVEGASANRTWRLLGTLEEFDLVDNFSNVPFRVKKARLRTR